MEIIAGREEFFPFHKTGWKRNAASEEWGGRTAAWGEERTRTNCVNWLTSLILSRCLLHAFVWASHFRWSHVLQVSDVINQAYQPWLSAAATTRTFFLVVLFGFHVFTLCLANAPRWCLASCIGGWKPQQRATQRTGTKVERTRTEDSGESEENSAVEPRRNHNNESCHLQFSALIAKASIKTGFREGTE